MNPMNKIDEIKQAREALSRFCKGKERICVPAQPDDDDMILSRALDELECLRAENGRLRAALESGGVPIEPDTTKR